MNIIELAREAGFKVDWQHADVAEIKAQRYLAFAAAVIAAHTEELIAGAGEAVCKSTVIESTGEYTQSFYTAAQVAGAVAKANAEIEQLRVQLAGCGVAALQNTESSKPQRAVKGDYGYSESYADVCRAVDREIEHRERIATLESTLKVALEALERVEPYVDQLVDYSSTAAEYPLNNAPREVVYAIEKCKEVLHAE